MRRATILLGLGLLLTTLTGCNGTRWGFLNIKDTTKPIPTPNGPTPTVASLVDYLNENSRRLQSVRVEEVDITASQGWQSVGARAKLVADKPRSFRMSASNPLGGPAVDLGSNDQEFWFYVMKNDPPYQYYSSYKDLEEGRVKMMPLPIQPEWIMETMGMATYGPADRYKLEAEGDTLKLIEQSRSPMGQMVRKIIVMKRNETRAPAPQVTDYILQDVNTSQIICAAKINEVTQDRVSGALFPRRMDISCPPQKTKMTMLFNNTTIGAEIPATAFTRQRMAGIESYNMARGAVDAAPVQRVQGNGILQGILR